MSADDELRILKPLAPYVEAIVGGKLILEVEISGSPSVCWLRDGFPVLRDNTHDFTHISNQSFSLQIDPVMLTDDGEYECNAQTSTGTTSCYAEVQVRLDDDVEFSQPLLPEEDRQSGLFILFDEGSQDEDEAEEEEDDDTIQSEGNDSRRKSMSASQQMEDILGDLALIEGTTGEKIDEEVESHRFSDAEEAKKQPVQVKKNVNKMASGHARLPAGDDSIPESPIPLQRDLSRGSSIATDASLRIMEVTSPTEGLFSDRAPLVREDSIESKGRLSETIDGVFITELEDDTIIEEQDEEVDDFYSDGADGNREKETDVVAEGTSKESSAYLPDDPDGDNKVREIIDETKTEDSAKNTYSSQFSKLSSEYEKMSRSNEVKTTRSDVQEIERKLEEKEDRQDFSLFKFDSMSSRQREITENKDEWNIGNITDSKKIIDDIFSSKDFEEPSSKIQKQRPEDDAWDFKKFSSVSSDYKKSSEETSSDVKTVHKTDYCDFKSATKYGNTESAHKLDTDERDILDYGENLKKASKYLKDCGETTDRYQKVLEDNELFSSSKRSPEVGKEFDSMKNWNSINTTSQTRHHEDIESTTELSNTFEDKKEEEEEEMKIKWGGKLTEENEHESKKARKRSIEIDEDFGSPKNKDSGRSTSQSQYRDDVVHKEKIFIDPKLAKKLSEVNGQENKHLVEIDENSSKNWDSGRSTSHSRYREELENSSKFSKKYDFKSAVGYEYSNEQYELGSDLLQSPAKSATNTRETSSGRHVGSLFDKASTVVREVEDIFERSKRELEGILDIATSKEIFNNKVRTKSDEDIFQSVEKELEDAFDAGLSVFGDVSGYRKRKLLGPRGPAGDLFELRRQSAPDDAKHDVGDLFDVRKSRKVEDIFEKTKQEMDEFFEDANEVLEEIHQPSSTFTGDDGFFSGSSIRTEIKSEQIGGRDISNLSSVGNADDFFKRESLDDRKSFQEDRNIKDMKRRWRKEVRADGEDIAKDMGISWPPSEGGHWMESSDDSSTSFGETRFKLKERGQQRDQLAVAEFTKDNSEQIDDDTSKLDEDSINDDESIFEDAEGKAQEEIFPLDSTPVKMSVTRSYESHAYTKSADYFEQSFEYKHSSTGGVGSTIKSQTRVSNFESFDTDDSKSEPVFDLYVAIADYIPNGSDDELIPLWEGQIVEVLDSHSSQKWLVRTRPTKTSPSKQGWVPPSYLERKTMSSTLRSIQEILEMEADSKTDSVEREAHKKRTQVVKELIETEDEFVRDMNHVVKTYLRDLDNPRVPMEIRDLRDVIFVNFEQISDFHNSVLAKGIQYYASEPARLGRTFLRLERDFDMHVNYCRDIQQAQSVLTVSPAKEYFEQYSQRIGEVDKTLQDHLKLPIQRINDYQILLKELIKFTARLKEDCTDLERALDLMLSIPQRAQDLEFINSIQGYRGNLLKLGRLLRHDWFTVTDKDGRAKERYLFLFKARILITKVKRISEDRSIFILQEVIKLPEVEVKDVLGDKCRFELHRKIGSGPHQNYPLSLTAKTEFVREAWLKEIKEYANEFVDLGEEEIKVEPEAQSETASTPIKLVEPCEELTTALTDSVQSESAASVKMDDLVISVQDGGSPLPPATFTWLQDNLPIAPNDWLQLVSSGQASPSRTPTPVQSLLEEPKVDSRPTTPGGTILPHAPHFTMKFKDTELIEEGSVTFMVKVRSLPEAEVKFFKDGKPLVENDHVKLVVEDRETFELQISHVKAEDAGKYSCVAKNSEGEETSEAEITVSDHKKVFMGMERSTPVENNVHPGDDVDFKWYRDGQEFEASERFKVMFKDEEDTLALVFQHVKPEDAGLYTCVASTCSGNIACSAELTVQGAVNQLMREPEAPKITVELTDTEVSTGGSAMLEVRVTGFPKPTVKWLKDGKEEVKAGGRFRYLHEDDESVALIIKNVTKEDSGKYKVIATNNLGEASTIGELIVKAPPKFNCQMKDISVMMDELVRFEVEIEGKPTPDITWYKDGRPVIATGRIQTVHETEETFALIIKKVQPDDAGSYSCQAENSSGKISEFSKLTVNSPPTFLKEIKRIECKETETIKFEAKVTGVPMPKVSWSMNGSEIKIDGKHFRVEEDEKNFTLTVDSVTRKDAGNFTCTLTNEHGSTSSSADLVVNCSPEFSQKLSDKTVKEGETNVTFDVKLSGTPEPKIRWFIDGMEIDEKKNNFKVEKDGDKHTLVIKKVTPDVSGKYTIKASNVGGEVNSSASLTVLYKPTFTEELKDREVTEGESVTYVVKVKGTPEPQIKWYKGNEDITVNAKIKFTHESTETWTMTLDCVAASAAGDYECRAHNSEGDASSKSKLTVNIVNCGDDAESSLDLKLETDLGYEEDSNELSIEKREESETGDEVCEANYTRIETTESAELTIVEVGDVQSLTAELSKSVTIIRERAIGGTLDDEFLHRQKTIERNIEEEIEVDRRTCAITSNDDSENDNDEPVVEPTDVEPTPPSTPKDRRKFSDDDTGDWWLEEEVKTVTTVTEQLLTHEDTEVHEDETEIPELKLDTNLKSLVQEDVSGTPSTADVGDVEGPLTIEEIVDDESAKPTFDQGLSDLDAWLGLQAILEVKVSAIPEAEVKWLKDGKPITASDRVKIEKVGNAYRLIIVETKKEDSGAYKCVVKNKIAEVSSEAKLLVKTPEDAKSPVFTHPIQNKSCIKGENATFEVTILGNPAPLVKWTKNGVELSEGDKYHLGQVAQDYLYRLTVEKCEEGDTAKYAVTAANEHGESKSEAELSVKVPPEITPPSDVFVLPKGSSKCEAKVTGIPQPKVSWLKNGKPLAEGTKFATTADDSKGLYTLSMNGVDLDDGGDYEVVAENAAGKLAKSFKLHFNTNEPKFTKTFSPVSIKPTTSVQLDVEVDGIPMPTVAWLFEGAALTASDRIIIKSSSERSHSLKIEQFAKEDAGLYQCKATSAVGTATCEGKVSVKHEKPSFSKNLPKETCAMDAETFTLEAKVDGSPQPTVKWLKDGKEIVPGDRIKMEVFPDGTVKLTVENAKPSDCGKYTVVATNETGELSSSGTVSVEAVPKPPVIVGELKKTNVVEGSPIQLSAKVTGHPKPKIKWFKDGKPVKPSVRTVEQPDGTVALIIDNAQPEDAGKYSIQVSNPLGEASSEAEVTVQAAQKAPEFGVTLKPCEAYEGFPIKLEGVVKGYPLPEIKWMKDGKEVVPDGQRVVAKMNPDGSFALLINESKPEDAGKYSCVAKNPEGTAESSADVTVNPRTKPGEPTCEPTFLTPLKDVAIDEGTPLKLQAHISSNPLPDMKWTKDGEVISPSDPRVLAQFDGDRVSLEIKKATPSDVGHYECTLTNPQGSNASACDVQVKKLSKAPIFTQRFPDLDSILGQDARFMCRVSGLPFPDISWYFNDRPISSSDKYKTKHEGDMYVLYIKNCTLDDIGNVSCVAKNSDGEDKCTAFHNVASKLDKKQKTEGPSFLKRLADCEVIEGMPGKFTACMSGYPEPQFKWYKDGRELFPSDRYRFEVEPHGLLRLIIKDIKREDMGRYMLKITNPHGEAESEGSLRCEGLEERVPKKPMLDLNIDYEKVRKSGIPFALPDKPIISKMTDRRLTLSWKPSIPIGPRVPVTYIVEMCEVTPDSEWLSIRNGIRGCCCEIKNLEPYRDYKYRIRVENKYGISDPSPYATAYRTKLEMTPPRFLPHLPPEFDFRPETSPYFPKDFDIDRPPHEAYAHAPRFMRQENDAQYGIRNQPSSIHWYVYGYPTPTITWYFNDERIDIVNRYESTFSRNGQVSLFINRFLERDIGIYECVAVNEHGESRQRVRMEISDPPVFSQHLDETTIMIRESGTLQCRCIGTPYPDIKWYKDWHPIVSSNRIKIEWKEPDICSLTITDAISKDGGLYSVGACNVAGMTSNSAMLTIEENELDYSILTYNRSRVVKSRRNKLFEDFYDIGDELGRGTQGIIYHTVERSTGNSYAARIMHGKGDFRDSMNYELDIMNQLHDRYLIRGIDAFDTKRGLTLITELASGGMLLDSLCKQSTLSESEIAYYMRQVLWGLEHMHGKGIAHLGLTAADILLARPGGDDIKICDFGLSRRLVRGQDYFLDYGMPEYVAPEIANKQSVSFYTDMWSVGVITYIFLSGISPFLGANDRETLQQVQQGRINFDADLFSHVSDEGKDFMLKLLMFDPNGRMDVKTALRHPWLKIADRTGTGVGYSTDRLINYHRRYRDWMTNSACRRFYRRRPLSSAYSHPSKMVYPPDEDYTPPSSPETEPSKAALWDKPSFRDKIDTDHEGLEYELGYVDSESKYQNGPDTYLLQLRDVGLPLRLREYMRVAGHSSPSLGLRMIDTMLGKTVTIHERRRFTDVMDEEIGDERKGCNDSVRKRITSEVSPRSETKNRLRELLPQRDDGLYPFFREKTSDIAYVEGEDVELSCYAVGDPKPTVQWYRNDVMLSETHRLKFIETEDGRSVLKFTPIKAFDAGVFKAIARNSSGDAACRARLRLGDISGRADAPEVSQVSGTQALVTWVPPKETGNAAVTGYDLEFKGMDSGDWQTVCQNIDHEFFVVGGLQPRSQYHFRVRATNKFGRGEFSIPSAMAVTGDETTEALTISRAMKHQQDLTISRQTETVDTAQPQTSPLNYAIEESPVEISTQNPSEKYNFIAEIARGRFSVVIKCCDKSTSQFFAAKIIDGSQSNEESAKRESEMICSLCHERLPVISDAYSFSNSYILVMEKLHGYDVLTYLTSRHQYNEETVTKIISQVLDALQYLHFRKILHLDIQPDNVVMTNLQLARVKLVDFGSSRRLTRPGGSVLVEDAGNLEYRAPEIIGNEDVTAQADVWSVGVLTYVILSGASPYVGADEAETKSNITFVRYQFENLFKEITPESTRFMMQIFKKTPFKRLTVDECLEHKWLNPSELMLRKRERAVFFSSRLQNYADEYHRQRSEAATATGKASQLMNSFGQGVSRSISTDCEEKTAV